MAEYVYAVLCQSVSVDGAVASLMNCIDAVTVDLPAAVVSTQPPSPIQLKGEMTLVSLWRRSDANVGEVVNVVVGIIDPAGNDLAKTAFTVDLNSGLICRQVTKIEALIVRGSGLHFLDIQQLNPTTGATTRVARLPLEVILKAMT